MKKQKAIEAEIAFCDVIMNAELIEKAKKDEFKARKEALLWVMQ